MIDIDTNKEKRTIMGISFDSDKKYEAALYAINSNLIEGWEPSKKDILNFRDDINDIFKAYKVNV